MNIISLASKSFKNFFFNIKYKGYFKNQDFHNTFRCDNYKNFKFGKRCYIGPFCHFDALGGLDLDDYAIIGPHVKIWTYNHDFKDGQIPYGPNNILKPVRIGKGAWIGLGAIILPGADVGEGAIVAAGSVVSGHVPDYHIARPSYAKISELLVQKIEGNFYREI